MKIGTIHRDDATRVVLVEGTRAVDVIAGAPALGHPAVADLPNDLLAIVEAGPDAWQQLEDLYDALRGSELAADGKGVWWHEVDDVRFDAPLRPRKNPWVIGANYYQHLANGYARIPKPAIAPPHVEFFSKSTNSIIGHDDELVFDKRATRTVDFECELTVVIGRPGKDVPVADAYDWVFGYTVANDMSARELQLGHRQYHRGKSLDGFCPLGPVIVTPRDAGDPNRLRMRQWLNGQLKQDWPVGDMIYKIDELISVLSQGMTIEPGEMIICGTVPGVGFEQLPQSWLLHGDVLDAEISRIGTLRTHIKQADAA
jgi:2-keto-4-pentenoate hydratase/2-oxohepta-3-ene-1,7-dioic acid hydratase in catechol pathway